MIKLAKENTSSDVIDIGFYGLYGSSATYSGLFRDANDSGKWKLFKDLTVEPTTTVDTSHASYTLGTIVVNVEGSIEYTSLSDGTTSLSSSVEELNHVDGVTSSIQTQLDSKQANITAGTNL